MRKSLAILLLCSCLSCGFFESKEAKTQKLINREMRAIDWNDVDNYPLFENCDESTSKASQKACFERELLGYFSATLREFEFVIDPGTDTTVYVDFLIDQEGRIGVVNIQKDRKIEQTMPEFDRIISQSLSNLPSLAPALKRGIPVRAKFRIPIVLHANQ
ncbi:hypothetical protein [Maribacter polysaccharolyticus]|uniref:hypothetical protein n=1 Tax=Maribacter polysaccharolyticus TaxID=3020831 RepID=UPI00237F688E|nr:hypothetical protein [Maribacter polysaccharolyticus]MDE3742634.1 hypothetical protein [Maribacter polysaccharolyticus]